MIHLLSPFQSLTHSAIMSCCEPDAIGGYHCDDGFASFLPLRELLVIRGKISIIMWCLHSEHRAYRFVSIFIIQLCVESCRLIRFEKFNRIPVRILQLDLFAARPRFHFIAKAETCFLQSLDPVFKIGHLKHDSVPSAWLLLVTVGHRPRTRSSRAAEN